MLMEPKVCFQLISNKLETHADCLYWWGWQAAKICYHKTLSLGSDICGARNPDTPALQSHFVCDLLWVAIQSEQHPKHSVACLHWIAWYK